MKVIQVLEPYIMCKRRELQKNVGNIFIPGQDEKVSSIREVVETSKSAEARNILKGDIVVTRAARYAELPSSLTEDDQVPFDTKDIIEIVDPSQVLAIYREKEFKTLSVEEEKK